MSGQPSSSEATLAGLQIQVSYLTISNQLLLEALHAASGSPGYDELVSAQILQIGRDAISFSSDGPEDGLPVVIPGHVVLTRILAFDLAEALQSIGIRTVADLELRDDAAILATHRLTREQIAGLRHAIPARR